MFKPAAFLLAGALSAGAYLLLGPGAIAATIYLAMGVAASVAVVAGIWIYKPRSRFPWLCLAAALACFAAGDSYWAVHEHWLGLSAPFPSLADAFYLIGYPFLALAAVLFARKRRTAGRGIFMDAAIVGIAAAVASWQFLIEPLVDDALANPFSGSVALAYPLADTFTFVALVTLLFTSTVRLAAFRLLLGGIALWLFADAFYAVDLLQAGYSSGAWFDSVWILAYALMGASALHPGMRSLVEAPGDEGPSLTFRTRIPLMLATTLATGIICTTDAISGALDWAVMLSAVILLPILGLGRLGLVIRERELREKELEASSDALRESEERYRMIVETASEGILLLDADNQTTFANTALADMLGWSVGEMLGKSLFEFIDDEGRPLAEAHIARRESGQTEQFEFRLIHRSGRPVWTLVSRKPLMEDGRVVGAFAMISDITERKRGEEAQLTSQGQFRAVFEAANDAMLLVDDGRRYVDANPAAETLLGRSREEILAMRMEEVEDALAESWMAFLYSGHHDGTITVARPDGSKRDVEFNSRANILPGRHLSILRDVTERAEFEARLRQAEKMEAVGRLAGGIAHDFNNLLLAIRGYAELALLELDGHTVRPDIEEIKTAADRAAALTQQLLAFSRNQVLQPTVLNLNEVVGAIDSMLRRSIGEDMNFTTKLEADLLPIKADRSQIEQVIVNLVINARDAMPVGGTLTLETENLVLGEEESRALFRDPRPGRYICLTVSDTGEGMDDETLAHALEPFFTTKEQGKGTGLGLATVDGITNQSGGAVSLESRLGEGTIVRIYLPQTVEDCAQEPTISTTPAAARGSVVLLVEDEDPVRKVVREMLQRQGHSVLEASNGKEGLALARTHPIDLLITDVVMPVMSGPELVERIAAFAPSVPVLYTSGYTDDAVIPTSLHQASAFLHKPFDMNSLRAEVAKLLARKAA
jgi:two-component system cell cycle sensor histidine kinase/response regulator CckA